jgi:hypothetical protein
MTSDATLTLADPRRQLLTVLRTYRALKMHQNWCPAPAPTCNAPRPRALVSSHAPKGWRGLLPLRCGSTWPIYATLDTAMYGVAGDSSGSASRPTFAQPDD